MFHLSVPLVVVISACGVQVDQPIPIQEVEVEIPPDVTPYDEDTDYEIPDSMPIDLVFIVDNTCSMERKQERLAEALPMAFAEWEGIDLDWTATVVTTDYGANSIPFVTGPNNADHVANLQQALQVGTGGDYDETARDALAQLVRYDIREETMLAVLIVSDDGEASDIGIDELLGLMSEHGPVVVSTLVVQEPDCVGEIGWEHLELVDITGGVAGDICSVDYTPTLMEHLGLALHLDN